MYHTKIDMLKRRLTRLHRQTGIITVCSKVAGLRPETHEDRRSEGCMGVWQADWAMLIVVAVLICVFVSRSLRYEGERPCKVLNVVTMILNYILFWIGSQWRAIKALVIWSRHGVKVMRRAASFITFGSNIRCLSGGLM